MIRLLVVLILLLPSWAWGTTWYVRPSTGEYGPPEDGSSYANAFDGFAGITWGAGGVVAGDTLLVCGTFANENIDIGASGTVGNTIKIYSGTTANGSSTHDPAILWAGALHAASGFTGPTNGVYQKAWSFPVTDDIVVDIELNMLYNCDSVACCEGQEDSWYLDDPGNVFYVNPGGSLIDLHFYYANVVNIDVNEKSYITFKDLKLYMGDPVIDIFKYGTDVTPAVGITIDNCEIAFGETYGIRTAEASHDLIVRNNTIWNCGSGIYHTNLQSDNYLIENNILYHNEDRDIIGAITDSLGDNLAIGIQGGVTNCIIQDNRIENYRGMGIVAYLNVDRNMDGIQILRNFINMESQVARYNTGISLDCTNAADVSDRFENAVVAYNVISEVANGASEDNAAAIRSKLGIPTTPANRLMVANNIFYDCFHGFYGRINSSEPEIGVEFYNNIVHSPQASGYFVKLENVTTLDYVADDNYYYGTGTFTWDGVNSTDFADWKVDSGQDANSSIADPLLVGPVTGLFRLTSASPCINTGTVIGLTLDHANIPVPQGAAPDIGAYEVFSYCTAGGVED